MKEENTTSIRVDGGHSTFGPVLTGSHPSINYGRDARDAQQVEALLEALLEQIHQHAGEMPEPDRAERAVVILRDEIRDKDSNPSLIQGALQRLGTAVDTVGPLVALVAKVTDAIQPWLR